MNDDSLFGFAPYHVLLAGCGFVIILAYWLPRLVSGREPAASALLIIGGLLAFGFLPGMPEAFDPVARPKLWELTSEFAVIVALFGTGLRIDKLADAGIWRPAVGLLVVGMPLTMAAVICMGSLAGLGIGAALLLAAVLAPTDPVLAADVQVGPPLEGGEHPVRFALTSEAGLNDGLAFPFVYLAIFVAAGTFDIGEWAGFYVGYKIVVGTLAGAAAGWALGKLMFAVPRDNVLADTGSGVVALAGVLFT
ncbi:MAG: sodium:proton antiporter, partial [Pseudomonadota bacterium]